MPEKPCCFWRLSQLIVWMAGYRAGTIAPHMNASPETPNILVFRKRLLAYSETFIADQGAQLPTMKAYFCGYQWDSTGKHLLDDHQCLILQDYAKFIGLSKLKMRSGLGYNNRWINAIKNINPAVIHAHFLNDGLEAINLGKVLSVPVITTLHGHDITKSERPNHELSRFFEQVDRVIAVSDFIAQQALIRDCPREKLIKHSIGIDPARFDQPKSESQSPSVLFVGRLVEKKGCTYLLQAIKQLQTTYPDITLTLVGDGPLKGALQEEAARLGLSTTFTGPLTAEQIRNQLATHWIFAAPSITADNGDAEGLGMVFLEAQAMATPVVSFASGGVTEAVADQETGLLCEEKDVASLATNLERLLSDSVLRRSMGESGRRRVAEQFNIHRQCEILEGHYHDLLNH